MGIWGCRGGARWRVSKTPGSVGVVMLIFALALGSSGFELEGSMKSYAKFPQWHPCQNGSVSFDFQTQQPNGLLFYMDDGGMYDFIEAKLVNGVARLRINLGEDATIIAAGESLSDGAWHKVEINRSGPLTTFSIDNSAQRKSSKGSEYYFGNYSENSNVFVGGLPLGYRLKLRQLALPSVMFEPRFRGAVRNLMYSDCGGPIERQDIVDSEGVRTTTIDSCTIADPCQHGGVCVNSDNGALCDCARTGFTGPACDQERSPSEATFFGSEYMTYDLSSRGDPIVIANDQISLQFRSRQPNGLLFYTGDGDDFITLALLEGGVHISMNLGSGIYDNTMRPRRGRVRFDDNRWHKVVVTRLSREVTVEIDDIFKEEGTAVGAFSMLTSTVLFVAGSPDPPSLSGTPVMANFRGCLRQVIYHADSITLNLMDLAQEMQSLVTPVGNILFDVCKDLASSQPVTFSTERSVIAAPRWDAVQGGGATVEFLFRTNEPNGLLMYSMGRLSELEEVVLDFFALEILDGHLYLIMNTGSGAIKVQATSSDEPINDGIQHKVAVLHRGRRGEISIDGVVSRYRIKGSDDHLDLSSALYVGGIYTQDHQGQGLPQQVWSAMLSHGYVGCMQDLTLNGDKINLAALARSQEVRGIQEYCQASEAQCQAMPCLHNAECVNGWNRFICDCSATSYQGLTCNLPAPTLTFHGNQYVRIVLPEESLTEVEDISLRFQTEASNGLLFTTSSSSSEDKLELALVDGQVRLVLKMGGASKTMYMSPGLDDERWHTVKLKRRAQQLELRVDNSSAVRESISDDNIVLHVSKVLVGSNPNNVNMDKIQADDPHVVFNSVHVGGMEKTDNDLKRAKRESRKDTKDVANFEGNMQQFVFNGNNFFDMIRTGGIQNIQTTANMETRDKQTNHPITFKSPAAYLTTQLNIYGTFSIFMRLKTTQPDGLIMYSGNGGTGRDFLAIEMVNGHVRYVFDVGSGPRVVRSNFRNPINDNKWHDVAVLRPELGQHILRVDDKARFDNLPELRSVHFDTHNRFYIGGIAKHMYNALPKQLKSRDGFQGCLGSIDLDDNHRDLLAQSDTNIPDEHKNTVAAGCEGPTFECTPTSCQNSGVCIQEWNSYTCDCDMTSFTGPTCAEDGIAYTFGASEGLITYSFPEAQQLDTKRDQLALGFITTAKDAILVRIQSGQTQDYIEMELVDGNVFVVYNMGTMDHPVGELFEKVNDGRYHVVRFTRSGPNSTIQVDDMSPQPKHPAGHQLSIFNNLKTVYIGGRKDDHGKIERPFVGTIAGLVLNGQRLLERAAEGDSKVDIVGDVELEINLRPGDHYGITAEPTRPVINTPVPGSLSTASMQSTMGVKTTPRGDGATDDIIFSGAGSGCHYEDEDDCAKAGTGTDDSFIKPSVTVHTTPRPPTTSFKPTPPPTTTPRDPHPIPSEASGDGPCEDDEDCAESSGSGTVVDLAQKPKPSTDDIDIEENHSSTSRPMHGVQSRSTTDSDNIFVVVNMTTERRQGGHNRVTTPSYPHGSSTEKVHHGSGGPGASQGETDPVSPEETVTRGTSLGMNIGLIVGIAAGVVLLLLILAYAFYKYRSRDEGSYKIDESKNYHYETCNTKPPPTHVNGGVNKSGNVSKNNKKKDVKEWYV